MVNFVYNNSIYYLYSICVFINSIQVNNMAKWHKIKKQQSGRKSSRSMKRAMQKLQKDPNMNIQEVENVLEVVIKTENEEIVIKNPQSVSIMELPGQGKVYQILGGDDKSIVAEISEEEDNEKVKEEEKAKPIEIPLEDVQLVAQQAGVTEDTARKALANNDGDLAKAIIELKK